MSRKTVYADCLSDSSGSDVECVGVKPSPAAVRQNSTSSVKNDFYSSGSEDDDLPQLGLLSRISKNKSETSSVVSSISSKTSYASYSERLNSEALESGTLTSESESFLPKGKSVASANVEPAAKKPRSTKPKKVICITKKF